ncbi:MAG: alpha/beta hydrolase [Pseudomonadales bacterium]|nr:alpha/beta hydrolase [Pseudomonadales bacterium]
MESPFDARQLRASLQPFEKAEGLAFSSQVEAYLDFYGIDFANQYDGLQHRIGYFDAANYRVVMQSFCPSNPKGTVFVFHGYYDHVGIFGHVVRYAIEQGYAVVAYDLPGHGLSSGPTATIGSFSEYQVVLKTSIELIKGKFPEPWYAIAQSTGAAVMIEYLLGGQLNEDTSPFKKIAMLAPLVRPAQWVLTWCLYQVVRHFRDYIERKFAVNTSDQKFLRFLQEDDPLQSKQVSSRFVGAMIEYVARVKEYDRVSLSPLVIQGDSDETVDFQYNIPLLRQKFTNLNVATVKGGQHQLANESELLRKIIFGHITQYFDA